MGDIIINQQRNDGYSHQNRSSFASFLFLHRTHTHTRSISLYLAFLLSLSFRCIFIYCIVYCACAVMWLCLCALAMLPVRSVCEPIFRWTIRYFANVTLSIRHYDDCVDLALFSNKHAHTIQSITFPSHFFSFVSCYCCCCCWLAGCSIARFSLSASPEYFSVSFRISEYHRKELRVAVGSCNLSLAYFLSFQ